MPILTQQVNSSSSFASFFIVITDISPVNFKLILFLLWIKESHQSPNFETFKCSGENFWNSSCHFWKQKSVFLQILHQYSVLSNITPLYFFRSNIIYFGQRQPIKVQIFEIFECSGQNSTKYYQFWNDKSIPLPVLQQPIKAQIFEIFECSGQNSTKSYQFWNDTPIPLPVLHLFSLPWQITPL